MADKINLLPTGQARFKTGQIVRAKNRPTGNKYVVLQTPEELRMKFEGNWYLAYQYCKLEELLYVDRPIQTFFGAELFVRSYADFDENFIDQGDGTAFAWDQTTSITAVTKPLPPMTRPMPEPPSNRIICDGEDVGPAPDNARETDGGLA